MKRALALGGTLLALVILNIVLPRVTNPWTILGAFGSLRSRPCTPRRVQMGERLPKFFLPVNL